jgi:dTDP-4-amino-4,6-dideoxygalactose transaminase
MGYGGFFLKDYSEKFVAYQGGRGYALPVSSGTNALYISIKSLSLTPGSTILVSAITDPGTINAIIIAGHVPKLVDCAPNSFNISKDEILKRIDKTVSAIVVVHSLGFPAPIDGLKKILNSKNIKIIEDCSQAHGAKIKGIKVGNFGDIAVFSTMYSKAHITGSSGGIIFTKNNQLFKLSLAYSDRGKPSWKSSYSPRDPSGYLFPSLNFNMDEISCSIGVSSLSRLDVTIKKRLNYIKSLTKIIKPLRIFDIYKFTGNESPYSIPIFLNSIMKIDIINALQSYGVEGNFNYKQIVCEWKWASKYMFDDFYTKNAIDMRDKSILLYVNENYTSKIAFQVKKILENIDNMYLDKD